MLLEHSFTVPTGVAQAWAVLLDVERVAPCMPGAALDSVDGDAFTGSVKVKLGPINLTYKGRAQFVEKDPVGHRVVIDARGKDARGAGTAAAKITASLAADGDTSTRVDVRTDLDITGKPAQFGRGVMVDVGNKLIGQFADNLAAELQAGAAPEAGASPAGADTDGDGADADGAGRTDDLPADGSPGPIAAPATAAPAAAAAAAATRRPAVDTEPIDLLQSAGPAVLKRLAPLAVAAVVLLALLRRHRRPA